MKRHTNINAGMRQWVLDELRRKHKGAAKAITWSELAKKAKAAGYRIQRDERNLREEVQELQVVPGEGALICGSSSKPYGIYMAETQEEIDAYIGTLESRIRAHAEKMRQQKAAAKALFVAQAQQMALGLG